MRHLLLALLAPVALAAQAHDHHQHHPSAAAPAATADAARLGAQLEAVRRTTARYQDVEAAKADGYVRFGRDEGPLMGEHWYRKDAPEPAPGTPVDLEHPGTLQYATIGGRRVLVGVAYSVRLRPGDPLPEGFAGAQDHWHQHDIPKFVRAATEERPLLRWLAEGWIRRDYTRKGDDRSLLTMVHAWVWLENPDGPFADVHRTLPYLRAGLPAAWTADSLGGDEAAARGVALVAGDGCAQTLDGELWVAQADRRQRRALRAECDQLAAGLRRMLPPQGSAADSALLAPAAHSPAAARALNAAAADAWRALDAAKTRTLTPRQRARIASVTEHGPMT
jgi:hypothetical protein